MPAAEPAPRGVRPGLLVALWVGLLALAWARRFVQDDAFISYRYAANWVAGHGLVFNPGERVEGYTNFLWVVLLAAGLKLGAEPVVWSQVLGLLAYALTLPAAWVAAREVLGCPRRATVAVVLLGLNSTFHRYATGGLETPLQALWFALAAALWVTHRQRAWSPRGLLGLSLVGAAALLTRPDSALLLLALAVSVLPRLRGPRAWAAALGPFILLIAPWLAWKYSYYGDLLPNTYYAKAAGRIAVVRGALFVYGFLQVYWLWPHLLVALGSVRWRQPAQPTLRALALFLLAWCAYLIKVGGDFMEFRLLVPVLPLLTVVLLAPLWGPLVSRPVRLALLATWLLGIAHHDVFYDRGLDRVPGVDPLPDLHDAITRPDANWPDIGRGLAQWFEPYGPVTFAITAAGAVPYYAPFTFIDMLGLNDRWVAREGHTVDRKPGHQKVSDIPYLLRRQVHLVVGHPWARPVDERPASYPIDSLYRTFGTWDGFRAELPATATVVEIPLDQRFYLVTVYLTPSPAVDDRIRRDGWRQVPIDRSSAEASLPHAAD
ncbi:MAG: hypothetical protein IT204_10895 [Fimbriimonadaceae bacterium]|nr:hypothetical protein [Fimbriimonadaceae bacterium]